MSLYISLVTRQGRNQTFNSAGNVFAAVSMGLIGYYISNRAVFFYVAIFAIPTILTLFLINPDEIDYARARGEKNNSVGNAASPITQLARKKTI